MMNLAFTRRPMSPALQAILDPARLLPTEAETKRTTVDLAAGLGLKTWREKRRLAKLTTRRNWGSLDIRRRPRTGGNGRPAGGKLTAAQHDSIIELFSADQWPSLGWIAKQVGTSKGQVDTVLAAAGLRKPAASKLAGQLEQLERSMRFRPPGHITKAELAERAGISLTTASNRLSRSKIAAVMVGPLGFYAEEDLRKAGMLP